MEPKVPSLTVIAFHTLLHISTSEEAWHAWSKQGLTDMICKGNKSDSKRRKTQELIDRLVKKGVINLLTTCTDNRKQEITIYWIGPKLDNCDQSSMQESRHDSVELSEHSAKRLSTGTPRRSMASIISKAQSNLNSSSMTPSSSSTRSFKTPNKKMSLPSSASAKKPAKSKFKSPLSREPHDPEIRALMNQKRELEKEIANIKENIRKAKLILKYQETGEDNTNEQLIKKWRRVSQEAAEYLFSKIPKEKSFLEEAGFSNAWGNWGWDEENPQKQRTSYSDGEDDDYKESSDQKNELEQNTMKSMLLRMGINLESIKWNEEDECFEE